MSQTFTVGPSGPNGSSSGAAIYLPNRRHPTVTLYNAGLTTVFLDNEDPLNQPSTGLPLTPGSSVPWDEDLALYATCPTEGTLIMTGNGQIPFDAGAIATAIINQGLAGDIAAAIAVTGAPPIDSYRPLTTTTFGIGSTQSATMNVAEFASISITIAQAPTVGTVAALVFWLDAPSGNVIGQDRVITGRVNSGVPSRADMPVRGPFCFVLYSVLAGGGPGFTSIVYGSYKARESIGFTSPGVGPSAGTVDGQTSGAGNQLPYAGLQTWFMNLGFGTTQVWQPDVVAGPARLVLRFVSSGTLSLLIRVPDNLFGPTTYDSESGLAVVSGDYRKYDLLLPPVPLEISIGNTAGAGTMNFRAALINGRPY